MFMLYYSTEYSYMFQSTRDYRQGNGKLKRAGILSVTI